MATRLRITISLGSTTNNRNKKVAAKESQLNDSQDNWIAGQIPHSGGFAPRTPPPHYLKSGASPPNPPNVNTPQNPQNFQITIKVLSAIQLSCDPLSGDPFAATFLLRLFVVLPSRCVLCCRTKLGACHDREHSENEMNAYL